MGRVIHWLVCTLVLLMALAFAVKWGGIFDGNFILWKRVIAWLAFWTALEFWWRMRVRLSSV